MLRVRSKGRAVIDQKGMLLSLLLPTVRHNSMMTSSVTPTKPRNLIDKMVRKGRNRSGLVRLCIWVLRYSC